MKLNRTTFFAYVRNAPFGGRLSTAQVEGMTAILDYWQSKPAVYTDARWLAYILATAFHETATTMQPVRETLASSDAQAVARLDKAYAAGKLPQVKSPPYWRPDKNGLSWFGRGLVQLTHLTNYRNMGQILGIPLAQNPSLALDLKTSVMIIFEGMTKGLSSKGDFTGKALEDYFNATVDDPIGARAIVNGKDKAKLIAGYHKAFLDAINEAVRTFINDGRTTDYIAPGVTPADAKPDDVPPAQSGTAWTTVAVPAAGAIAAPVIGGINNVYALIFSLALLAFSGLAIYMFASGRWQINRSKSVSVTA